MEEVEFKLSLYRCVRFELKKKRGWGGGKPGKRMFRERNEQCIFWPKKKDQLNVAVCERNPDC